MNINLKSLFKKKISHEKVREYLLDNDLVNKEWFGNFSEKYGPQKAIIALIERSDYRSGPSKQLLNTSNTEFVDLHLDAGGAYCHITVPSGIKFFDALQFMSDSVKIRMVGLSNRCVIFRLNGSSRVHNPSKGKYKYLNNLNKPITEKTSIYIYGLPVNMKNWYDEEIENSVIFYTEDGYPIYPLTATDLIYGWMKRPKDYIPKKRYDTFDYLKEGKFI